METNSFKEYSVLAIMSKEEQQQMKACLMFLRAVFKPCEGSIYEQTFSVTNGRSYQPRLSTLQLNKKHLQKRDRIFRRDREPSRIPGRTQEGLYNTEQDQKNVSFRVH